MFRSIFVAISIAVAVLIIADASALAKPAGGRHAQEQVFSIEVTSAGFVPAQQYQSHTADKVCGDAHDGPDLRQGDRH